MPKTGEKPANRLREATALLDSPQITAMFEKVRTAVEPQASEPPGTQPQGASPSPAGRTIRFARLGIAVAILATWWSSGGVSSASLRLTLPGGVRSDNVVTGQTSLYNGDFFHNHNLPALGQLDLLKGNRDTLGAITTVDDPHIGYASLGNLFTVGLSSPYALWALNLALYALCAWLVARLTERLFGDRTKSTLAAGLFVLSISATLHVGDLSPLLLAIAFFFAWTLLLLRIELEGKQFGGPTLFGLAAFLGAWSLVSPTSILGLISLGFCLCRRRRFLAILIPAMAWYAVPRIQQAVFANFGWTLPGTTEASLVWDGLKTHADHFWASPARYGCFLAVELIDLFLNDNPLNVLLGLAGLIVLRHRVKWLMWVSFLTPIAVGLLLLPTSTARGLATAGNTIVLFAVVSHIAVEASRWIGRKVGPTPAIASLALLVGVQAVWSHSIFLGWLYPAGSYATGAVENAGLIWPADFVRMTGPLDDIPTVAGGGQSACVSYGLADGFGRQPVIPAKRLAPYVDRWSGLKPLLVRLALQAPFFGCLLAAALALLRPRWGIAAALLMLSGVAAAQLCGAVTGLDRHVLRSFDDRIIVKQDEKLVADVRLSDDFRQLLQRATSENLRVEFAVRLRGTDRAMAKPANIQVDEWASDESPFEVDAAAFLDALNAHHGRVELAISPKPGSREVLVHSWQSLGDPEGMVAAGPSDGRREASIVRPDGSIEPLAWFPSFEIRVVRGNNAYPFKTVLATYEPARPAGYVLIGF